MDDAKDIRYLTEQEEARERLKASVDRLSGQVGLQVQMQKEPLKMIGGASAVGAVLGVVLGRQLRRSKKIYVDAASPVKHQKAFIKAQQRHKNKNNVSGALVATLGTMAVKLLTDKVLVPKLEEAANNLLEKSGQKPAQGARGQTQSSAKVSFEKRPAAAPAPSQSRATSEPASLSQAPAAQSNATQPNTVQSNAGAASLPDGTPAKHPGIVPLPASHVEAKAQGTPIPLDEKVNPNAR